MPPLAHWALEDIQQTLIIGGWKIETDTDVACHQWLRHTLKPPQKHSKPIERRGLIIGYDARFCFVAYCDVEQEEAGDTLHHTFFVPSDELPPVPSTPTWPLYEPWGTFLAENYPWQRFTKNGQPVVTFEDGIIKVANTGRLDVGIALYPPPPFLPLRSSNYTPLTINLDCPTATAVDEDTLIYYEVWLTRAAEDFNLYLQIARGSAWDFLGDFGAMPPPPVYRCWKYLGTGEHTVNLLALWQAGRAALGLDANPDGWHVTRTGFSLTVYPAEQTEYVKCDHVGLYLPVLTDCNQRPWPVCETRWFYFWATNEGERMKSTSCIFSKGYHPGDTLFLICHTPPPWHGTTSMTKSLWASTTFKPAINFTITQVKAHLYLSDPTRVPEYLRMFISPVLPDGRPLSDTIITSGQLDDPPLTTTPALITIPINPAVLNANVPYSLWGYPGPSQAHPGEDASASWDGDDASSCPYVMKHYRSPDEGSTWDWLFNGYLTYYIYGTLL